MSSGLQVDVRHHIQWRNHLVNAYEVKAGMVFFAGKKLCDPCLSALMCFVFHARRYTSALLYLFTFINVTLSEKNAEGLYDKVSK